MRPQRDKKKSYPGIIHAAVDESLEHKKPPCKKCTGCSEPGKKVTFSFKTYQVPGIGGVCTYSKALSLDARCDDDVVL